MFPSTDLEQINKTGCIDYVHMAVISRKVAVAKQKQNKLFVTPPINLKEKEEMKPVALIILEGNVFIRQGIVILRNPQTEHLLPLLWKQLISHLSSTFATSEYILRTSE